MSEKTVDPRPALRQSPRGGMLYTSGVRGNRGGTGRPITHGRYSRIHHETLRRLIAQQEADPDPLNLLPDLAACRALFQDYIERYEAWRAALIAWHESYQTDNPDRPPKPVHVLDIADAYRILSEATKIAKRIEDVRAQNTISRHDFIRVMQEMARVVEAVVEQRLPDAAARDQMKTDIKDRWLQIRLT